ncbi:MoaF-related domain-containing protein [Polaribacter ponticola]|uniref:MoaF N-terminal domain-containing protein n=1 Tax=Polaribacter ponticola TaxID=2978475 RepID=A0ABT5S598_9FLAO|nr:MoaF N-terminal domain-containing protein [Polaribacter sp. MSW5]MDD7913281.1 MoaF N-terminal domain-containing protein [Polaribacter sp. MSW5]
MKKSIYIVTLLLTSLTTFAQTNTNLDKEEHLLNGTSFTFQYQNAGAVDISFANDSLTYKWLNGRNADKPAQTYSYKSTKIDAGIYLVNWHEPDTENFVTQVYNFNSNTVKVSVISKYGGEKPFLGFQSGVIEHVVRKIE